MIIYSGCKSTKKISFTLRFPLVFFATACIADRRQQNFTMIGFYLLPVLLNQTARLNTRTHKTFFLEKSIKVSLFGKNVDL